MKFKVTEKPNLTEVYLGYDETYTNGGYKVDITRHYGKGITHVLDIYNDDEYVSTLYVGTEGIKFKVAKKMLKPLGFKLRRCKKE